jgi:hypothetical protein
VQRYLQSTRVTVQINPGQIAAIVFAYLIRQVIVTINQRCAGEDALNTLLLLGNRFWLPRSESRCADQN